MDAEALAHRLLPLIDAAPRSDREWLRRLLLDADSHKAYSGIDTELFVRAREGGQSVLVTSTVPGEGRTAIVLSLCAIGSANDRTQRTLLVDASLADGRLGDMLGEPKDAAGLAEYFDGTATFDECVRATALENLHVVARARHANGATGFSPRAFARLMGEALSGYDRVVVDGPARSLGGQVVAMATSVANAIVVVRYRGPTVEQVGNLLAELEPTGCRVLGCVLNRREYPVPGYLYGRR